MSSTSTAAILTMKANFINVGQGDATYIEIIIAMHPDHLDGMDEVLEAYKFELTYAPKIAYTTDVYANFLNSVRQRSYPSKRLRPT